MLKVFPPTRPKSPGLALVTEEDYFPVLENLLAQATREIIVMAFSFVVGDDKGLLYFQSLPFKVMEKLKALKKEKGSSLRIRVFLEGARDTAAKNRVTAAHLKKGGIEVTMGGSHAKGFCVDGRYTLLGSTNLTGQSLAKNFETNLLIDDPRVAAEFSRYFEHYWQGGQHGEIKLKAPLLADGAFKKKLIAAIKGAKASIAFSIYFFEQAEIEAALIAAAARGVKIRGLVHDHAKFALSDVRRTRATVERLRRAGVKGLSFSSRAIFTHSKYLVADRENVVLGSGNWLNRDVDTHPQIYVNLKHRKLGVELARHLKAQIVENRPP
ncbi:MAG: hypothetical protein EOP11_24645 [Proteobacteria bacterium]|nr:MAG: hypothetical protein EOP11_24645 [Pseudomonadota bacterium]